jgi:ABC-type multidrug transport system permease subunit
LIFFSIIFAIMGHQKSMPALFEERLLFYRERGSRAYGPLAYWSTSVILSLPLVVINILVYSIIVYPIAGLNSDSGRFEVFFATLLMCSASGLFCCRMLAALSPTEQSAINLFPVTIYFLMAFSGFGIYLPQMQNWLAVWAPYASFIRWAFQVIKSFD